METGFPYGKDQIISEMGTIWATIALSLAVERPATPAVAYNGKPLLLNAREEPEWLKIALFGTTAELKALLDHGLDPNSATAGGTPLLLVVAPEADKLKLIVDKVADINIRAPNTRFNALMVAAAHTQTRGAIQILLDHGARLDSKADPQPSTVPSPLFLASGTAEPAKAALLLANGDSFSRLWTRGTTEYTPLGNAVDLHDSALIRDLVKAGAPINPTPPSHLTPLARAVTSNQTDLIKLLIELGADVNQRDGNGISPLEYAAYSDYGNTSAIQLLLAAGARRDRKGKDGLTAADIARKYDHAYMARVLETPVLSSGR